jgi:hypothetical protein
MQAGSKQLPKAEINVSCVLAHSFFVVKEKALQTREVGFRFDGRFQGYTRNAFIG